VVERVCVTGRGGGAPVVGICASVGVSVVWDGRGVRVSLGGVSSVVVEVGGSGRECH
jgi:hypothetical protein